LDRPLTEAALAAVELAVSDPRRARIDARAVSAAARRDPEARTIAERALGLAAQELNDVDGSLAHLRRAVAIARRAELRAREDEARQSLALSLAHAGRTAAALREADRATGARAVATRALILSHAGRHAEAVAAYTAALAGLRADRPWRARALNNRGIDRAFLGDLSGARADLERAAELFEGLGLALSTADTLHNLGWVAGRAGDVPGALALLDRAAERFRAGDWPRADLESDRCEILLGAGLLDEARAAASRAVRELGRLRLPVALADARLRYAAALAAFGDLDAAAEEARAAERAFRRQGRARFAALARFESARAAGRPAGLRRAIAALDAAGWRDAADDARISLARVAPSPRVAVRPGPTLRERLRVREARALAAAARGDVTQALRDARAGLRLLAASRALLGAADLRAGAARSGEHLAALGLRLALEHRSPAVAFSWAEETRARALDLPPVRPPDDPELARAVADARRLAAAANEAALSGEDARLLRRAQAGAEDAVRRRLRHLRGAAAPVTRLDRSLIGDRTLIEYAVSDDRLVALVVTGGRIRRHDLGSVGAATREIAALRFALDRIAIGAGRERALEAAHAARRHAAGALDEMLIGPLGATGRELVIVPTGALHALAWSVLPSLAGRIFAVAPSAAAWTRAAAIGDRAGHDVVIAGPGLRAAEAEVADIAAARPGTRLLVEPSAEEALAALDGARLAHVAAHGEFRADNPLFSCLHLADGPLTAYDLQRLRQPPLVLVLSSCESGLTGVAAGDELLGLAAVLLASGTRAVIASTALVPDAETRELMLRLHAALSDGASPAAALARAGHATFVCIGAG
jgi:tetratricopeptide (TPR) repeat protein